MGNIDENVIFKLEILMKQAGITTDNRKVTVAAKEKAAKTGVISAAIELNDGTIITSKTSSFLGTSAALILNAVKHLANWNETRETETNVIYQDNTKQKVYML